MRLPSSFPVGTKLVIEGHPAREGRTQVVSRHLEFPDGTLFLLPPRTQRKTLRKAVRPARVRRKLSQARSR
jgi:hypothetical protein